MVYLISFLIFKGILEEVARTVHGIQLTTSLPDKPHEQNNEFSMYRIRLYFDNQSHLANKAHFVRREQKINYETQLQLPDLPGDILMKLFPFCIAFRPDMKIFKVGVKWEQLFPYPKMVGKKLPEVAHLRRPKINLTWQNVIFRFIHSVFYLFFSGAEILFICFHAILDGNATASFMRTRSSTDPYVSAAAN